MCVLKLRYKYIPVLWESGEIGTGELIMTEHIKKRAQRSPNYPIQPLQWAVETALTLLEKEGLHAIPADIVAQNLGYKDSSNGKVRRVLANLKAFGVIDKAPGGKLTISQGVQRYKLIPSDEEKNTYLKQWLKKPLLYKKLLDKHQDGLPSDAVLLFELVDEHGFNEEAAGKAIKVFRASLDFVKSKAGASDEAPDDIDDDEFEGEDTEEQPLLDQQQRNIPPLQRNPLPPATDNVRYPIRLAGGRMAWIEVPERFYEADKNKLRAQIEIIGTEDEDNDFGGMEM